MYKVRGKPPMPSYQYGGSYTPQPRAGGSLWERIARLPYGRRREEEEEDELLRVLQARSATPTAPSLRAAYDDPILAAQSSIQRVGGPQEFNYRLATLTNEWGKLMGPRVSPSILLDLARSPVDLKNAISALETMARSWNLVKGLSDKAQEEVVTRYLERGVPMLSAGAYSEAVNREIENSRERRGRFDPIRDGTEALKIEDVLLPRKIVQPFFMPFGHLQMESWRDHMNIGAGLKGRVGPTRPVDVGDTFLGSLLVSASASDVHFLTDPNLGAGLAAILAVQKGNGPGPWDKAVDVEALSGEAAKQFMTRGLGASFGLAVRQAEKRAEELGRSMAQMNLTTAEREQLMAQAGLTSEEREIALAASLGEKELVTYKEEMTKRKAEAFRYSGVEYLFRALDWYDETTGEIGIRFFEQASASQERLVGGILKKGELDKAGEARLKAKLGAQYEARVLGAKELAAKVYEEGGNFGTWALTEQGLDPAEHPWLNFLYDFTYHVGFDVMAWGGASAGIRALQVPKAVNYALRRTGVMDDLTGALVKQTNKSRIEDLTDIADPVVLDKLAKATTRGQVEDVLTRHVVEAGGLRASNAGFLRQVRAWAVGSKQWDELPPAFRRTFEVFKEGDTPVYDMDVNEAVHAWANAYMLPKETAYKYADEAIGASMIERIGILKRMTKEVIEADPKKWKKLEDYWARRPEGRPSQGVGTLYNLQPWAGTREAEAFTLEKGGRIGAVEKRRAAVEEAIENTLRQQQLATYARPTDPDLRLSELRRLGFTDREATAIVAGQAPAEQAAAKLAERAGGPVVAERFYLKGTVQAFDDPLAVPSAIELEMAEVGLPAGEALADRVGYGALLFRSEKGRLVGGLDYTRAADRLVVENISVPAEFQRKGITTRVLSELYDRAAKAKVGVQFRLADEWEGALARMGIPKTEEGFYLAADEIAKAAAARGEREARFLINEALSTKNMEPAQIRRLRAVFDQALQVEVQADDLERFLAAHLPSEADVLDSAQRAARELNASWRPSKELHGIIKKTGGISIRGSEFADRFLNADEVRRSLRGLWSEKPGARRIDDLVTEIAGMPEGQAVGIKDIDSFMAWLADYRSEPFTAKELLKEHETAMRLTAIKEDGLERYIAELDEVTKTLEATGKERSTARQLLARLTERDEIDDLIIDPRQVVTEEGLLRAPLPAEEQIRKLQDRLAGYDHLLEGWRAEQTGARIASPLYQFQLANKFSLGIPLQVIQAHYAGGAVKALDRISRVAIGERLSADSLTAWFKRYMLVAPGTMIKVVGDEPIRMAVAGYNPFEVFFGMFGKSGYHRRLDAIRSSEKLQTALGQLDRMITEEAWATRMPYFVEGREPGAFMGFMGSDRQWPAAMQYGLSHLAMSPQVKAWTLDPTVEGLIRWLDTKPGTWYAKRVLGGRDPALVREWAEAQHQHLYELTHYPVSSPQRPMGQLSAAELKSWDEWVAAGGRAAPREAAAHELKAGALRPKPASGENYLKPLSEYTDRLFRETNLEGLDDIVGKSGAVTPETELYFANAPDLALGQGKNVGVLMEFDVANLQGYVRKKPAWEVSWESGRAEFVGRLNSDTALRDALRSFTIKPAARGGTVVAQRMKYVTADLEKAGWQKVTNADGSRTWLRPGVSKPAALPRAEPPVKIPPGTEVKFGRIYAVNHMMADMLRGQEPILQQTLRTMPRNLRPGIAAPQPRGVRVVDGKVVRPKTGVVQKPFDKVFGGFDFLFRNNRKTIFAREFLKRYGQLEEMAYAAIEKGGNFIPDPKVIWREADRFARHKVESMSYNANRTGAEWALRDVLPFAPAARDFTLYWLKQSLLHPPIGTSIMRLQEMPFEIDKPAFVEWGFRQLGAMMGALNEYSQERGGWGKVWSNLPPVALTRWSSGLAEDVSMGLAESEWTVNAHSLLFWLGGAGAYQHGEERDMGLTLLDQQLPGINPLFIYPAQYAAEGLVGYEVLAEIPDFWEFGRLAEVASPLNSRLERFTYGLTAMLHALGTGGIASFVRTGHLTEGDFRGWSPPGFLGRNPDIRNSLAADTIRAVSLLGEIDWSDPDTAAEQIYQEGMRLVAEQEGLQGILGLILPGTHKIRNREVKEVNEALSAYVETYRGPEQKLHELLGVSLGAPRYERIQLMLKYPELAVHFEFVDALQAGDQDRMDEIWLENPGVASFFVTATDNVMEAFQLRKMEEAGIQPEGFQAWLWQVQNHLRWPSDPEVYANRLAAKQEDYFNYIQGRSILASFEKEAEAAGLKPQDQEYRDKKTELLARIKAMGYNTGEGPFRLPPEPPFLKERRAALEAQKEDTARILAGDYEREMESRLGPTWRDRGVEPLYRMIKSKYEQEFERRGLQWPKAPSTKETREQQELDEFLRQEPWAMDEAAWAAHGLGEWDPAFRGTFYEPGYAEEFASMRNGVYLALQAIDADIDDKKAQPILGAYRETVAKYMQNYPGFARAWSYYQKQDWERLRDTGNLYSPAWRELFSALAERDHLLLTGQYFYTDEKGRTYDPAKVFRMFKDTNKASKATRSALDMLNFKIEMWRAEDPKFREEFDQFSYSFFDYVRKW